MTALLTEPTQLAESHHADDAQEEGALGTTPPAPAASTSTPIDVMPGRDQTSPRAVLTTTPMLHTPAGTQTDDRGHVAIDAQKKEAPVASRSDQPANSSTTPESTPLADPTLALAADVLDDLERVKIANQNRLRALTRDTEDSDGEMRGFGLDESHPDAARLAALVQMLEAAEHQATLNLQRAMRKHPLGPWVKAQRGIGEKQAARLLAKIGDPYINGNTGQPRTVSALWAYSGLHVLPSGHVTPDTHRSLAGGDSNPAGGDPGHVMPDAQSSTAGVAARRRKGQQANWSTHAKTRAWLIVQSCMKQLDPACKTDTGIAEHHADCDCSPYRVAIDERRTHTAITHPEWTPGHSLADAQRVASKRLLRDLWREARRIHEGASA